MKKCLILLFITCALFLSAAAQKHNTYFLKNSGDHVTNLDSANYIRLVEEPEKGSTLYPVKEFYPKGNRKSYGYSSTIDPPRYEGQYVSFFENGNKKQILKYKAGKMIDTAFSFYPNGRLYAEIVYQKINDSTEVYFKTILDSAGKELVKDGNGRAVVYDDNFEYVTGQGNIKNGTNDGEWFGELRAKDTLTYKEKYAEGKMISGESTDGKGNVYQYTTSEILPIYKGGMTAFFKHISHHVRYPPAMARQRSGGVVHIKFEISRIGEISNLRAVNDVQPEFVAEALRVIKEAKEWEPGIQKGRKVNGSYVVPITFTLSN